MGCLKLDILDQQYKNCVVDNYTNKNCLTFIKSKNKKRSAYLYGFNGKEKDFEIKGAGNSYDFGERIYDPRLGRWLSVDPKFKKYPSSSPYNFAVNSPIFVIDPDGGDIIVLSAANAVKVFGHPLGHAAVLIGDDKNGWTLYSKNGTYGSVSGSGSSGDANKHPQNGIPVGSLDNFALNYNLQDNGDVEYTSAFRITTSKETDAKMAAAASKQVGSWYDVTGMGSGSCIDVCTDALEAGGLNGGTTTEMNGKTDEEYVRKSPIPNSRFAEIKAKNKGTDVTKGILPSKEQILSKIKEFQKAVKIKSDIFKSRLENSGNKEGSLAPKDNTTVVPH
jgi:RHS repeat-associated protein